MTILFGNAKYSFQDGLSSRPERSVVERSAVSFPAITYHSFCALIQSKTLIAEFELDKSAC
jgi:hypothetical protein